MAKSDGFIVNAYIVYCADCDTVSSFEGSPSEPITREEMIDMIVRFGWATYEAIWRCPECQQKLERDMV